MASLKISAKSKMSYLKDKLNELENYYSAACMQLVVLNLAMERLTDRYVRAERMGLRTCRYSLRMRMAITEGVRNMFYEFATKKAHQISQVRQEILVEHAFSEDSGDEMDESYLGLDSYINNAEYEESDVPDDDVTDEDADTNSL